jgi:hypothetical protein
MTQEEEEEAEEWQLPVTVLVRFKGGMVLRLLNSEAAGLNPPPGMGERQLFSVFCSPV